MQTIGIPYAPQEWDPKRNAPVAVCPECDERIPLIERKDWESWTGAEYQRHYQTVHQAR